MRNDSQNAKEMRAISFILLHPFAIAVDGANVQGVPDMRTSHAKKTRNARNLTILGTFRTPGAVFRPMGLP